ncbi:MAG: SDR family oxidoreductase [Anaerolineales bacterium]|nr:SDR family oxidoreductase [Anaerolineales bacterium]
MNLVTGATGHIGNVLVRKLLQRGERVRALILPGEETTPIEGLEIEKVEGDVLDFPAVQAALSGVDYVFHLAGLISIMPGYNPLLQLVNVVGTRNVLHAARESGVRRMVYTSSIHALSDVPHGIQIDEQVPFDPQQTMSEYGKTKAQASIEVKKAVNEGLDAVLACPTGVIGPYDFRHSELGQIIHDCAQNKPQLYIDGAYDFVDVRDVAEGLIAARDKGRTGETYILSGELISVRGLLDNLWEITGRRFLRLRVPLAVAHFAAHFTPLYYRITHSRPRLTSTSLVTLASNANISHAKAQQELGFAPRPISEALVDTVQWFQSQRK